VATRDGYTVWRDGGDRWLVEVDRIVTDTDRRRQKAHYAFVEEAEARRYVEEYNRSPVSAGEFGTARLIGVVRLIVNEKPKEE